MEQCGGFGFDAAEWASHRKAAAWRSGGSGGSGRQPSGRSELRLSSGCSGCYTAPHESAVAQQHSTVAAAIVKLLRHAKLHATSIPCVARSCARYTCNLHPYSWLQALSAQSCWRCRQYQLAMFTLVQDALPALCPVLKGRFPTHTSCPGHVKCEVLSVTLGCYRVV